MAVTKVSVIVPIFNGLRFLPDFFDSLLAAIPPASELILVNDSSSEPVFDAVPEFPASIRVVRLTNERNLGYSAAVNRGLRTASGEIVVQLNTDLVLEAQAISALVRTVESASDVGIVGSRLLYPSTNRVQHIAMAFGNHTMGHVYKGLPSTHPLGLKSREMQIMTGATVAMSRHVLDRIGLLDERYFNCHEDIDHCLRSKALGLRNLVTAESVAYHWESQSGPARFARVRAADARFWSTWGNEVETDLPRFFREALSHVRDSSVPDLGHGAEILNLARGVDSEIAVACIEEFWPDSARHIRHYEQFNNPDEQLLLPLILPTGSSKIQHHSFTWWMSFASSKKTPCGSSVGTTWLGRS